MQIVTHANFFATPSYLNAMRLLAMVLPSNPLEKVHIRKLLHLIDVAFRLDHLLIVVQNPCLAFVGDLFADKGYVVSILGGLSVFNLLL